MLSPVPPLVRLGLLVCGISLLTQTRAADTTFAPLPIEVKIDAQKVSLAAPITSIPTAHKSIEISIGSTLPEEQSGQRRVRFKMEPFDSEWREIPSSMSFMVRFLDSAGDQVEQKRFPISGHSPGWAGSIESSRFVHRSEELIVPPHAQSVTLSLSSSGPPTAMGVYVVDGIKITRKSGLQFEPLFHMQWPERPDGQELKPPEGWSRTGTQPSMAKTLPMPWLGQNRAGLYIADDNPSAHAAWRLTNEASPAVEPTQELLLEWDEIYSIGMASPVFANYPTLPAGNYRFSVNELDVAGKPTSRTQRIELTVPSPFWKTPWFWTLCGILHAALIALLCRWIIRIRLRKQLARVHEEHLIERERLRIARDIHDDLGARLTHISLISACAENTATSPLDRENFCQISGMTKELVVALYETIWTVNPENDQIEALLDFICQLTQNLCQAAGIRCRLYTPQISVERRVTSELRHHVVMAVKEAVNNSIKHGSPSELDIHVVLTPELLSITLSDNGRGFPIDHKASGRGLQNMKHRMDAVSGRYSVESTVGSGTKVHFEIPISAARLSCAP